ASASQDEPVEKGVHPLSGGQREGERRDVPESRGASKDGARRPMEEVLDERERCDGAEEPSGGDQQRRAGRPDSAPREKDEEEKGREPRKDPDGARRLPERRVGPEAAERNLGLAEDRGRPAVPPRKEESE